MLNLRKRSRDKTTSAKTEGFAVRTRLGRAAGKDERYACGAVRVLPSPNKGEVVLQVTDGHQAACVLNPGRVGASRLVPADVLPTRQRDEPVSVRLVDGAWQSTEGRTAEDRYGSGEAPFPPIADVLPAVGAKPHYETARRAATRRDRDDAESTHVVLALDLDVLRKTADALGTRKLTLFVPVPVKPPNARSGGVYVDKAVPVCPAEDSKEVRGVGVIMPMRPTRTNGYYRKTRDAVINAERKVKHYSRRTG